MVLTPGCGVIVRGVKYSSFACSGAKIRCCISVAAWHYDVNKSMKLVPAFSDMYKYGSKLIVAQWLKLILSQSSNMVT